MLADIEATGTELWAGQAELEERFAAMQTEQKQAKAAGEGVKKIMTVVQRRMN